MEPMVKNSYNFFHARDRFGSAEYLLDSGAYEQVMDTVKFYHESIYLLPDSEVVHVQKIEKGSNTSNITIPINHLIFE